MTMTKEKLEKAITQPWTVYQTPEEVLTDSRLDDSQKRRVLESWEHDARELAVAEDENMGGGEPNVLDRVLKALATLPPANRERPRGPSTTHGSPQSPSSAPGSSAPELSPEAARQGQIILNTPLRRGVFIGALLLGATALLWAYWIA